MSRSSLSRYAPLMREADPNGAHRVAKRAWHERGAVAFPEDMIARMPWEDREFLRRIAAKNYGPRQETKRNG